MVKSCQYIFSGDTGDRQGEGLDRRKYYHIINDYSSAATVRGPGGRKNFGKQGSRRGHRGEFFRKNIDNFPKASYTYKVKIWAVLA
jgi:hypothetical protein